jgi:hypothetical protein
MTISELGGLGEFLSSIAVLTTLIFLVIQFRQNAKLMRRANARQASDANSRTLVALLDEGVSELFIKGLNSLESLSEVERYRFDNAFAASSTGRRNTGADLSLLGRLEPPRDAWLQRSAVLRWPR